MSLNDCPACAKGLFIARTMEKISYSEQMCLDCARTYLRARIQDHEQASFNYKVACLKYCIRGAHALIPPSRIEKPLPKFVMKKLDWLWNRRHSLAIQIRAARCRVANAEAQEDMKRQTEGNDADTKETGKKRVTFAPSIFDNDGVSSDSSLKIQIRTLSRSNPTFYRPGVYGGKEYLDTSGYLEYSEDFYCGNNRAGDGTYWPERSHSWVADLSSYTTPLLTLTNEFGDSRTLVQATLPRKRELPFLVIQNSNANCLRVVTSAVVQSQVDRYILRPKTRAMDEIRSQVMIFRDDLGLERMVYWKGSEIWIKTNHVKKVGQQTYRRTIHSEPWQRSVLFARRWKVLRETRRLMVARR